MSLRQVFAGVDHNHDGIPDALQHGTVCYRERLPVVQSCVPPPLHGRVVRAVATIPGSLIQEPPNVVDTIASTPVMRPTRSTEVVGVRVEDTSLSTVLVADSPVVERRFPTLRFQTDEQWQRQLQAHCKAMEEKLREQAEAYNRALSVATVEILEQVLSKVSWQFDDISDNQNSHNGIIHGHLAKLGERMEVLENSSRQVRPSSGMEVAIMQEEVREVRLLSEFVQDIPAKFELIDKRILSLEQDKWPMKDMENLDLLSRRVGDLEEQFGPGVSKWDNQRQIFEVYEKMAEMERKMGMKTDTVEKNQELIENLYERLASMEQQLADGKTGSDVMSQRLVDRLSERIGNVEQKLGNAKLGADEVMNQRLADQLSERISNLERKSLDVKPEDDEASRRRQEKILAQLEDLRGEFIRLQNDQSASLANSNSLKRSIEDASVTTQGLDDYVHSECKRIEARLDAQLAQIMASFGSQGDRDNAQDYMEAARNHEVLGRLEKLENHLKAVKQQVDGQLQGLRNDMHDTQAFAALGKAESLEASQQAIVGNEALRRHVEDVEKRLDQASQQACQEAAAALEASQQAVAGNEALRRRVEDVERRLDQACQEAAAALEASQQAVATLETLRRHIDDVDSRQTQGTLNVSKEAATALEASQQALTAIEALRRHIDDVDSRQTQALLNVSKEGAAALEASQRAVQEALRRHIDDMDRRQYQASQHVSEEVGALHAQEQQQLNALRAHVDDVEKRLSLNQVSREILQRDESSLEDVVSSLKLDMEEWSKLLLALKYDLEETCKQNSRDFINMHQKIAMECALCNKMATLHRNDVLQLVMHKQVWLMQVRICSGRDFRSASHSCEVTMIRTGATRQTKAVKGTHPVWDEEFEIPDYAPGDSLLFSVFEGSMLGKTLIGKAMLSGEVIDRNGSFRGDLSIEDAHSKTARLTVEAIARLKS